MGRISYVCAECSEHFTRKTSGKRHNLNLHGGRAEIVRLIEYLVGIGSGRYEASHPFWFKRSSQMGLDRVRPTINRITVADSTMNTFKPHKSVEDELVAQPSKFINGYTNDNMIDHPYPMQEQAYSQSVSGQANFEDYATLKNKFKSNYLFPDFLPPDAMRDLLEMESLAYKTFDYHDNPSMIVQHAMDEYTRGDLKFLRDKLNQLRQLWRLKSRKF